MKSPIEYFLDWEKQTPDQVFLRQPKGKSWKEITYGEAAVEVRKLLQVLIDMGLKKGDHIGILSKNCYHWIIADLAISLGGYISVPYYASLPKDQLKEVVEKSDIKLLFAGKLDEWGNKGEALNDKLKVIKFPHYEGNAKVNVGEEWAELMNDKKEATDYTLPKLDELWTILFTSGTTGSPKGVMLNYRNVAVVFRDEEKYNTLGINELKEFRFFSFLPLNHVAERIVIESAALYKGGSISFGESIDTFVDNLKDTQPTVFFAVPRIWSKFQSGIFGKIKPNVVNTLLSTPILSSFFRAKLKVALGLAEAKIVLTGAALTPVHLKKWYRKLGLNLREVYGATEACGAVTLTPKDELSDVNVGKPIAGSKIRIDEQTGEIIYFSEQNMQGYYKDPEKTQEILKDGWIYSGDKGNIDENGSLHIVGRVKDAFKTEKGKYITPNPIEENLLKSDLLEQACVVGLTTPQPIALVNLSENGLNKDNKQVSVELKVHIEKVNQNLANYERISTIVVTKEIWSEQNKLLTPTLKVKRNKIDEKYMNKYLDWHRETENIIMES